MSKCYLFIDISDNRAAIVRLAEPGEDTEVEGRIYERVENLPEMVSTVLDMSHGDADGVIMASQMQARDWVLELIECEWYVTLRRVPEINGQFPRPADFDREDGPLLERLRAAIAQRAGERAN